MNNINEYPKLTHKIDIHEKDVLREAFPAATNRQIKRIIELNINPYILEYYNGMEIKGFYTEKVEKINNQKKVYENKVKKNNFINDKIYFRIGRVWIKNKEGKYDRDGEIVYIGPNGEYTFNGIIQCKLVDIKNASTIYATNSGANSRANSGANSGTNSGANLETNSGANSGINIHYVRANKIVSSGNGSNQNTNESRFDINRKQFIYVNNLKYFLNYDEKSYLYLESAENYITNLKKLNSKTNQSKYSDILEKYQILELLFAIDYKNQLVINDF